MKKKRRRREEGAGYFVSGHDWPAIDNSVSIEDIYAALRAIDDEQVRATGTSLLAVASAPRADTAKPPEAEA